ncbi:hypothetical protein L1787_12905 [Acuticoccus sp. M5D2P5]|uniref:hypothetical protein n=1 Tax=Acuticoccus kalidii TaxID=2910977 RepID=UPI001F2126DF|nr:hypothetical protein [Acuticoccus kalidii]MCF3934308.1 hypothetical protein [Acuticoccus kalidii]
MPVLYAPESGFDPATIALKVHRQIRRENTVQAMGWPVEEYRAFNAKAGAIARADEKPSFVLSSSNCPTQLAPIMREVEAIEDAVATADYAIMAAAFERAVRNFGSAEIPS